METFLLKGYFIFEESTLFANTHKPSLFAWASTCALQKEKV
jgi:hypothetical protein